VETTLKLLDSFDEERGGPVDILNPLDQIFKQI
jgi:hypothetical protein